ncbi:MAG TPA: FGGY-family carbohydrate kinase, partial [Anaerolineales bacterium]
GLKDSFRLIQNAGLGEIKQVRASGGGTKGAQWRQILASVLEAELVTAEGTSEGAAFGAALLAGVGAGVWSDVSSACKTAVKITGSTLPDSSQVEAYHKAYPLFQELYPALKSSFVKMG